MDDFKSFMKVFLILLSCTLFIYSFSFLSATAVEVVVQPEERLVENAQVGPLNLSRLRTSEAENELSEAVENWQDDSLLELHLFDEKVEIDSQLIFFDIEGTIQQATQTLDTQIVTSVSIQELESTIEQISFQGIDVNGMVDHQSLAHAIEESASSIQSREVQFNLYDYFLAEAKRPSEVVSETTATIDSGGAFFQEIISSLDGTIIQGKSLFSLLESFSEQQVDPVEDLSLNMLASTIYETLLKTNFQLVERHTSRELSESIQLGLEANVRLDGKDLALYNPNVADYTLQMQYEGNELTVALEGIPFFYTYQVTIVDNREIEPRTIIHFSEHRRRGDKALTRVGQKGLLGRVNREVIGNQGELLMTEFIADDYYPAVHENEEWSVERLAVTASEIMNEETDESQANGNGDEEVAGNGQTSESENDSDSTTSENDELDQDEDKSPEDKEEEEPDPIKGNDLN